jgi:adenylate cyclase
MPWKTDPGTNGETHGADHILPRVRMAFRLRPTLVSVLIGLLVATVGCVGIIVYLKTDELVDTLVREQFATVGHGTVARAQQLVDSVPAMLREYESLAQRGMLPLDDKYALGEIFVERLRQHPELISIGFADVRDASYVSANRRADGGISVFRANPNVNDSIPVEVLVDKFGHRFPVQPLEPGPFHIKERRWFRIAQYFVDLGWMDPYEFSSGKHGAVAALPVRLRGAQVLVGILQVDLRTDSVVKFLDSEAIGEQGRVHILASNGAVVAMATAQRGGDPVLDAAIRALPGALDAVTSDGEQLLEFSFEGVKWAASFSYLGFPGGPDWIVSILAPDAEFHGPAKRLAWLTAAMGFSALLVAALLATVISSRIAVPLRIISEDLEKVSSFTFDDAPPPRTFIREVSVVGQAAARMKSSLRSFSRYVPDVVVRELLTSGREAVLGGERRRLTIHFSDIAGYTSIAENLPPEQMVDELADYFTLMRSVLRANHGTIDKYMGDGILAFFNAPLPVPGHETLACVAALEAQARLAEDRVAREAAGRPVFHARIGLGVGEVIVGNIGTPERFAYTAIGDAVNLASRLEGLNKFYGTTIMGSAELMAATGDAFEWRRLDRVAVLGRSASTDVCELLGRKGAVPDAVLAARDAYEAALDDYLAGRFAEAAAQFRDLWRAQPASAPIEIMARRSRKLARRAPESEWDGIYVHAQK